MKSTYSYSLVCGADYKFGIRLVSAAAGGKAVIVLKARNEHDRSKFVDDLKDAILEVGGA